MTTLEEISKRLDALEATVKSRKTWIEFAAIPLAVAVTGIFGTWFVTRAQMESAAQIAKANLEVAERSAVSQQRLKALELHIKYITDRDPAVRESGVKLLSVIEPELANKLRQQVIATEKDPKVLATATQVNISGWFPVVSSKYTLEEARQAAEKLNRGGSAFPAHVYKGTDDKGATVYAVTLGGYLSKSEAQERVSYAKQNGIAADAFALQHANWGQNLIQ